MPPSGSGLVFGFQSLYGDGLVDSDDLAALPGIDWKRSQLGGDHGVKLALPQRRQGESESILIRWFLLPQSVVHYTRRAGL